MICRFPCRLLESRQSGISECAHARKSTVPRLRCEKQHCSFTFVIHDALLCFAVSPSLYPAVPICRGSFPHSLYLCLLQSPHSLLFRNLHQKSRPVFGSRILTKLVIASPPRGASKGRRERLALARGKDCERGVRFAGPRFQSFKQHDSSLSSRCTRKGNTQKCR